MKSLKRDLFERRLWPLAVVIVAAIVAVPFLLHGHSANADIAAPPASSGTATTPASTPGHSHRASAHRTAPTSHTRDPFKAAAAANVTPTTQTTAATSATSNPSASSSSAGSPVVTGSSSGAGSSSSSAASSPVTTTPATTTPAVTTPVTTTPGTHSGGGASKPTSWDIYSVDLRIGAAGSPVAHHDVARLAPLPSERSPQVMYMGVAGHGHAAVFALGAGVEVRAIGGARSVGAFCHPSRVDCALAVIPAGKSVAIIYVNATGNDRALVLKVTRVSSQVTQSESVLKAARSHVSAVGLCDLKLGDPIGFFDLSDTSVSIPSTGACRSLKRAVPFPGSLGAGSSVRG